MRQFPTTQIDNNVIAPARTVKSWQHARKTVRASQKKACAVAWSTVQTRVTDMLTCGCARTRVSHSTQVSYLHIDIQSTRADITLCECGWVWCVVAWCVCVCVSVWKEEGRE